MKHNLPECAIKPLGVHQTPYINTSVEEGTWNYVLGNTLYIHT